MQARFRLFITRKLSGTRDPNRGVESSRIEVNARCKTHIQDTQRDSGFCILLFAFCILSISPRDRIPLFGCGSGKKFLVTYTNQIVINSSTFSAGGDSGSLIVSNTNPSCRQPVALLYAGAVTRAA